LSRTSAWRRVTDVPAGPRTFRRTKPTMFWPMSTTVSPAGVFRTFTGRTSSIFRTGGPAGATSGRGSGLTTTTGAHSAST
jgi:hypothetical protein